VVGGVGAGEKGGIELWWTVWRRERRPGLDVDVVGGQVVGFDGLRGRVAEVTVAQ
jgi:hypothetical protein